MSISYVQAALETAQPVLDEREVASLCAERDRLLTLHKRLLPVETQAKAEIKQRWETIDAQIATFETAQQLGHGLSRLDPSVLSWATKQKAWRIWCGKMLNLRMPVFAYIPVDSKEMEVRVGEWSTDVLSVAPPFVRTQFSTATRHVQNWVGDNARFRTVTLRYSYNGVIPGSIRQTIEAEQAKGRFDQLALVCDAKDQWTIDKVRNVNSGLLDPILVGVAGKSLWVLGAFDPTPTEQYLLDEFTQ